MHHNRMKVGLLVLTLALAPLADAAAQNERWLHVRVQDGSDANVAVNLPLSAVGAAADLVPEDVRHMQFDGADVDIADLRAMWSELRQHPNEELVKVDEPDQQVIVSLLDGYLRVRATGNENVEVRIPAEVVDALFSGEGNELAIGRALEMLVESGEQELVTVQGDTENVRIWVDSSSSGGNTP